MQVVYGTETVWGGIVAPDSPVIWRCDGEDPIIGNGFETRWAPSICAGERRRGIGTSKPTDQRIAMGKVDSLGIDDLTSLST
jgi:hypothetical protein